MVHEHEGRMLSRIGRSYTAIAQELRDIRKGSDELTERLARREENGDARAKGSWIRDMGVNAQLPVAMLLDPPKDKKQK
jgi:hypothetical protein